MEIYVLQFELQINTNGIGIFTMFLLGRKYGAGIFLHFIKDKPMTSFGRIS